MKEGALLKLISGAVLVCSFLFSSSGYAATIYTRLIDTSYIGTTWYHYISGSSGTINFNATSMSSSLSELYTHSDVYTLSMTGKLTFTPNLTRDYSSGGLAEGYFQGGVTVTITGGLKQGSSYVYGGTGTNAKQILQATLTPVYEDSQNPAQNCWALEEDPLAAGNFNRTLFLQLVNGSQGLASGILLTTGDTLAMQDPKMDLSLKSPSINPDNFISTDISTGSMASTVKISGTVPEPITVLLMGVGTLLVRRRK